MSNLPRYIYQVLIHLPSNIRFDIVTDFNPSVTFSTSALSALPPSYIRLTSLQSAFSAQQAAPSTTAEPHPFVDPDMLPSPATLPPRPARSPLRPNFHTRIPPASISARIPAGTNPNRLSLPIMDYSSRSSSDAGSNRYSGSSWSSAFDTQSIATAGSGSTSATDDQSVKLITPRESLSRSTAGHTPMNPSHKPLPPLPVEAMEAMSGSSEDDGEARNQSKIEFGNPFKRHQEKRQSRTRRVSSVKFQSKLPNRSDVYSPGSASDGDDEGNDQVPELKPILRRDMLKVHPIEEFAPPPAPVAPASSPMPSLPSSETVASAVAPIVEPQPNIRSKLKRKMTMSLHPTKFDQSTFANWGSVGASGSGKTSPVRRSLRRFGLGVYLPDKAAVPAQPASEEITSPPPRPRLGARGLASANVQKLPEEALSSPEATFEAVLSAKLRALQAHEPTSTSYTLWQPRWNRSPEQADAHDLDIKYGGIFEPRPTAPTIRPLMPVLDMMSPLALPDSLTLGVPQNKPAVSSPLTDKSAFQSPKPSSSGTENQTAQSPILRPRPRRNTSAASILQPSPLGLFPRASPSLQQTQGFSINTNSAYFSPSLAATSANGPVPPSLYKSPRFLPKPSFAHFSPRVDPAYSPQMPSRGKFGTFGSYSNGSSTTTSPGSGSDEGEELLHGQRRPTPPPTTFQIAEARKNVQAAGIGSDMITNPYFAGV